MNKLNPIPMRIILLIRIKRKLPVLLITLMVLGLAYTSRSIYLTWNSIISELYSSADGAYNDAQKLAYVTNVNTSYTESERQEITQISISSSNGVEPQKIHIQQAASEQKIIVIEEVYEDVPVQEQEPEPVRKSVIDFPPLQNVNADVIGWIKIADTQIDYPIVQGTDNDFYLFRSWDGTENINGAIFADSYNANDFTDMNTFIYGHHMNNGSMFANLQYYKDQDFFEQHPEIIICTPKGDYTAKIFAAYTTTATSTSYSFVYNNTYLNEVRSKSFVTADIDVSAEDRIITLSTCDYDFEDARMVVHAVIQ